MALLLISLPTGQMHFVLSKHSDPAAGRLHNTCLGAQEAEAQANKSEGVGRGSSLSERAEDLGRNEGAPGLGGCH